MTKHILIADDDADDRMFLKDAFKEAGIDVDVGFAQDGLEVFAKLLGLSHLPALIMLDLNMPKKDGFDVLAELKSSIKYRTIPVIIFSTSAVDAQIRKCYELGANSFITKPGNFRTLVKVSETIGKYWLKTAALP